MGMNYPAASRRALLLAFCLFSGPGAASAQAIEPDVQSVAPADQDSSAEIIVFGRGESKIGEAQSSSEGTVAGHDLLVRPLLRVAELLEAVPGMVAAQHSGSGKANQYFLRGFNLDHGSDFTTYVDGVQMNLRSHGHGQGYLDLNGLIPELIDREDYRKGPYRASDGDFALAGAAYMHTVEGFAEPWTSAEVGSYGWRRAAVGGTISNLGDGDLSLAGQAKTYDGPWQKDENVQNFAGFLKYALPTSTGRIDLSVHAYSGRWDPTEQIPERIVDSPVCSTVFCSPDPSATGRTDRVIANLEFFGDDFRANASAQFYDWEMFSNPTYTNVDGRSAQIRQYDKRWAFAAQAEKSWKPGADFSVTLGTDNRLDQIGDVGVDGTDARRPVASFGAYRISELSVSAYAEAKWQAAAGLRLNAGARADHYHYSVTAKNPEAAALGQGSGSAGLVSAKLGSAYKLSPRIEVYANWGQGFHSNDVRGAVTSTPVPVLVRGTGHELGARFELGKLNVTATYWWLRVGSELRFVGDSNSVEPTGASSRRGFELVSFWRPLDWLAVDANFTVSRARYDNGDFIPNAFDDAGQLGLTVVQNNWKLSARLRHLGGYPLDEDNSVRDSGSNILNIRGAYKPGRVEIYAEVLNVLDSRDKDIAYFYESYIPGFDAQPIEGRLSRVLEPRTFRIGTKLSF